MKAGWKLVGLFVGGLSLGTAVATDLFQGKDTVIANEGRIGDRWMLADGASLATPVYPAHLAGRGDDVCMAIGYRIMPDGRTSEFSVLRQWSSAGDGQQNDYWGPFAEAGADALSQWRFQPRPGAVVRSTYTVATVVFSATPGSDGAAVRNHCRVDDLATFLQKQSSDGYWNSRERHDLDRASQAARARNAMVENPVRNFKR